MIGYLKKILRESNLTRKLYIGTADTIKNTSLFYIDSAKYYTSLNPEKYTKNLFNTGKEKALRSYEIMKRGGDELRKEIGSYTHPVWEKSLTRFRSFLVLDFNERFLRNACVRSFISLNQILNRHREYIKETEREKDVFERFKESQVGSPKITRLGGITIKPDSVDHLHYLGRVVEYAKSANIGKVESIMEFGGGYGNLAYCARLYNPDITYTIIDFPELLTLAYAYNAINFPEKGIHICDGKNGIRKGALNLLPIGLLPTLTEKNQIFISTYALTETPKNLIEYVKKKKFLGSDIAYLQGGIDPVFNSHATLLENISEIIESPERNDHADKSAYELIGMVKK